MRLFISINLSAELKYALADVQNAMLVRGMRGNYTTEENMHLTLAFIGEYPDVEPVLEALRSVAFTPFEISLEGLGCFRDLWWVGIRDSAPLTAVVRRVRRALAEGGISFDRKRFSPHITLIRKAAGVASGIRIPKAEMTVDAISLMRSDRGRKGMIYTEIGRIDAS